ncbi:MAG TPA: nitroreductase family protein [Anaerolineaceae bacterium]|nr:nitroreductase family protein [Longilinea sp.]NMD30428.1 nitroreductase family protein [Chloroflexota bacterium]HNZ00949.1 nitroreductase family protein [Anaerolineaceae bacterium]HOD45306.1 nitroreductase family protein [Anaerolineaceae bacterium]HOH20149.1 nitroreductase family protein [Anaerolineaceae bacterium]
MSHPVLDLIFSRRSIRKYTDQPVDREVLVELLQAGMAAPSAMNSRPWEFAIVTDPVKLDALRKSLPFGNYQAPAAIIPLYNPLIGSNPISVSFWQQDLSAAVQNILITASGMGLGTVWIGVHPMPPLVGAVRKIIKAPRWITPLCVIYVGHPDQTKSPRTQYEERRVHWDEY